jgi:hypothetical protein
VGYNEWLDIDVLEAYLEGKLDSKAMHQVEKLSLEDPFVAEALDGLSQAKKRTQTLSLLQKQLQERVVQKPVEEKRWRITSQRLSIAAAAAVLFVTVSILFWMKENKRREILATQTKQVEANTAPIAKASPSAEPSPRKIVPDQPLLSNRTSSTRGKNQPNKSTAIATAAVQAEAVQAIKADSFLIAKSAAPIIAGDEVVTIARKAATDKHKTASETALPGKVAGIYFDPNSQLKGKPGVLINGTVYAKTDGQPLPGAIVQIAGTNTTTTTNAKGEFTLPVDSNFSQSLSIGYIGFDTKKVEAKAAQPLKVALEESNTLLRETVVTRSLSPTKPVKPTAIPSTGWANFTMYLNANNKLITPGVKTTKAVRLTFALDKKGRPLNIKVKQGLGNAENEEAIRLIKEGPSWTLPKNAAKRVELEINF